MGKLFTSAQIRSIDEYTITHEPVSSYELMERASVELFRRITSLVGRSDQIVVFAGTGNNGGDGLAVGRMMLDAGYKVSVNVINVSPKRTIEWETNYNRLINYEGTSLFLVNDSQTLPVIPDGTVVVDAIFGSGLTRSPEGLVAEAIKAINESDSTVISIDVPSGLPGEDSSLVDINTIIRADYTLAIEFPRLSFMFAENHCFTGKWITVPIGLHPMAIARTETPYRYLMPSDVAPLIKQRGKFDHKGHYGHALLASGSYGKMGAAILAARAALRTGAGLLTCHIPAKGYDVMQTAVPEAMVETDQSEMLVSEIANPMRFDAIGVGPGMGSKPNAQSAVKKLLTTYNGPMVIDADAINILALNREWLKYLTPLSILTPHPGEFLRIAGETANGFERMQRQREFSIEFKCIVILKGAHTSISLPDGRVYFNSTGNPGMATAGSGDVLTGIILGLLSQGYSPDNSAILGVNLHGLAGDIAAAEKCQESVVASDIIEKIYAAYNKIREELL